MLDGKIAVVTGGTGSVGEAIVRTFVREGCRVAYTFNSADGKARSLDAELGEAVRSYRLDVTDGAAAAALAKTIQTELGPVDILVNNAGVAQVMPFAMIEEDDWDLLMDTNVKGMFLVTKAFARGMIRRKSGVILNMGSLAGMRMLEVPVHYATSKSAVVGFTLSLSREFGRYGVRVNAVVPGMLTGGVSANIPDKQREQYEQYCALSRAGEPAEVAELVAFLASSRSSYINGQAIFVDGGI